ncbi:hypothetical protein COCOBI_15-1300 [Coccomyxa sp. Obi]|nr:hypothetical protein COCOBI_15-1300 [Coccomyxa sp. Obi]
MKAVIKSQELAFEAGRLLLTTRAYTQQLDKERLVKLKGKFETSEEAVVMEKSIVKLIKAALLHHGTCTGNYHPCVLELDLRLGFAGFKDGFTRALDGDERSLERSKCLSWLHLLAAVPIVMALVSGRDPMRLGVAVQIAETALAFMKDDSRRWEALLEPQGLSLWEYELVVRMHQLFAIYTMPAGMPTAAVLRQAIKVADDDGDDSSSVCLRHILCHAIFLGAEGPSFMVAEVTAILKKAVAAMKKAESWTNPIVVLPPEIYWPCVGVAVHWKAVIREDPSFWQSRMPAYAS